MLYTWNFAAATCGWTTPKEFDARVFAKASDASVGEEHCPWSDWHDDQKVLDLIGSDMAITHRQVWQGDFFVWYSLSAKPATQNAASFFDAGRVLSGIPTEELFSNAFKPIAARTSISENGLLVHTSTGPFEYAVSSSSRKWPSGNGQPNAVRVDLELLSGGVSVGILDTDQQVFLNSVALTRSGRHTIVVPFPPTQNECQIIFSNHRVDKRGASSFVIRRVELISRSSVVDSPLNILSANQLIGSPASELDLSEFWRLLERFPRHVADKCKNWIEAMPDNTWIATGTPNLARFRMAPARSLKQVGKTLRYVRDNLTHPARIIWILDNEENRGLDAFEIDAVFGAFMDIDLIHQIDPNHPVNSRTVVAGRIREEIVGLTFRIDRRALEHPLQIKQSVQALVSSGLPIVAIFLDHETAQDLLEPQNDSVRRIVQQLVHDSEASLGLYVPTHRVTAAANDWEHEVEPLLRLSGPAVPVDHIRFEDSTILDSPNVQQRMADAGFRLDSSTSVDLSTNRRASEPYVAGAYQPQQFDRLSPAGLWRDRCWIESPRLESGTGEFADVWRRRQNLRLLRMAHLLDFKRMEKFHWQAEKTPSLNRRYGEYRVYNWPPASPSPRTSLFDGGDLSDTNRIELLVRQALECRGRSNAGMHFVGHQSFLSAAIGEAKRRLPESANAAVQAQIDAHGYLEAMDPDLALRQDEEHFLRFLPQNLGRTLEMGSGTGRLARTLAANSEIYICTDMKPVTTISGISAVVTDVHNLPFDAGQFSTVIANNILEHLYDPLTCLKEIVRVLVPEGHLYALIPLDGLNPDHQIRTHLWKADEMNIRRAIELAGLVPVRLKLLNLHELGINAAFPSCNGFVCHVDAKRSR
jgi:SAM-dependent methyltransferase